MVRNICRFVLAVLVMALISEVAGAYTLVFRDGRRLEIPDQFVVSKWTVTYELAPGIQRTVQMATIDVAATERVNRERAGSFLKRASVETTQTLVKTVPRAVTNQQLERFKTARLESEAAYERRRKELGLPPVEESKRAAEAQSNNNRAELLAIKSQEREAERYWRTRASELRAEIAATNARIDFVRARLNEVPSSPAFGVFTTALPFGLTAQPSVGRFGRLTFQSTTVFSQRQRAPQITGAVRFGGGHSGGQVLVNPVHGLNRSRFPGSIGFFPAVPLLSIPFQNYDYYQRSELMTQLDELLAYRAGLQARWRDLEEEARRAGAYYGWLRP